MAHVVPDEPQEADGRASSRLATGHHHRINGEFQTRIGASIVEEFVTGHDASDVLGTGAE